MVMDWAVTCGASIERDRVPMTEPVTMHTHTRAITVSCKFLSLSSCKVDIGTKSHSHFVNVFPARGVLELRFVSEHKTARVRDTHKTEPMN